MPDQCKASAIPPSLRGRTYTHALRLKGSGSTPLETHSLSVRQFTLHDLPELTKLFVGGTSVLGTPKAELRHCMGGNMEGVHLAVGPDGRLLGAAYTQRIASYEALLTRPESVLPLQTPSAPILHLIGIVQQREARVRLSLRLFPCLSWPSSKPLCRSAPLSTLASLEHHRR